MLKFGPDNSERSGDARYGQGKISGEHQSIFYGAKEKVPITKTGQNLFFQNKGQIGHPLGKMYVDPKCVFRQKSSIKPVLHSRCSLRDGRSSAGYSESYDDELVKHMSSVPSFLQRAEKDDSLQEKALNFGVLDWKKLETWKYNERMPKRSPKKKPPSSNSLSSPCGPPKMSPIVKKSPSSQDVLNPEIPDMPSLGKKHLMHAPRYLSPNCQPASTPSSSHLNASVKRRNLFPPDKKCVEGIKSKEKEQSNHMNQSAQKSSMENPRQYRKLHDKDFSPTYVHSCGMNNLEKKVLPRMVALSSEQCFNLKLSPSSRENSKMTFASQEMFTAECCPMEKMFMAPPRHSQEGSFSGSSQVTESGSYLDEQLAEAIRIKLHDFFSPQELYSEEFISSTRHSCPLPSRAAENKKPSPNQKFGMKTGKNSSPAYSVKPMGSEGKISMMHVKTTHHLPASVDCEKELATIPARPSEKGRYPSPSRFSFNFGKMSRTFSFKDISVIPQRKSTYSSTRSGPVKLNVSSNMDNFGGNRDQEGTANNKGRSSPLRRLLDPWRKHKVAQPTNETSRPSKGRPNFMTFMTTPSKRQSQDKKKLGVSVYHALVQVTVENGVCFFEFLVDDKSDMLAAAVKRSPTTTNVGSPCVVYTFYSVREVRKMNMKWMTQGSKHKSGNLGYNDIGQMIMSTSNHSDTVECILYGAASGQAVSDKTHQPSANKELAAVVVRYLNKSTTHKVQENGIFNNTLLILPSGGGGHGMPAKGTPTSLISRWKSNGVCDCGGWDVGCKLRILTDSKNESNVCPPSTPNSLVSLFQEGEKQKSGPLFTLEPLNNGYYSVSVDASIPFLEAFATCVAYITCREFPELIDAILRKADAECLQGDQKVKGLTAFQGGNHPAKYVTCPPLSPAARI